MTPRAPIDLPQWLAKNRHKLNPAADPHGVVARPLWGPNDRLLAQQIERVLGLHYPGYDWHIGVWAKQGCVVLRCIDLPSRLVYVIRWQDLGNDPGPAVKRAAGELLERAGIRRGAFHEDGVMNANTHVDGTVTMDLAGVRENNIPTRYVAENDLVAEVRKRTLGNLLGHQ